MKGDKTMTPKMMKFHVSTGKRETFRPHEMKYPQWNDVPGTRIRVLIDETGKMMKYEVIGETP